MHRFLKQQGNHLSSAPAIVPALFEAVAERALADKMERTALAMAPLSAMLDYQGVLVQLAALQPEVDAFFDTVLVRVDDQRLYQNRLALLSKLRDLLSSVADIALLFNE